eukprot:scaffold10328_cov112-Isochrysis_galbana.AAC.1
MAGKREGGLPGLNAGCPGVRWRRAARRWLPTGASGLSSVQPPSKPGRSRGAAFSRQVIF